MGVVEVAVEISFTTIDKLISDILYVREAVDSLVVTPSLYPKVKLVGAHASFKSRRLDLVHFRGWAMLSPYSVGAHVGVEESNGGPCVLMTRDGATISEGARQVLHLRRP